MDSIVKIPVHSLIDLITNSSTEIFVNSEDAIKPAKELLTELLKLNGSDKTCDDVFDVSLTVEDYEIEQFLEYGNYDLDQDSKVYKMVFEDKNPDSLSQIELKEKSAMLLEKYNAGDKAVIKFLKDSYHVQSFLVIKAKDSKYQKFAILAKTFLYSTDSYEHSWG